MKVKSRKTEQIHYLKISEWKRMEEVDPSSQRRYIVLDSSELELKTTKISIEKLKGTGHTKVIPIKPEQKPIEIAIVEDDFNSEDFTIKTIANYLANKDLDDYIELFENDPRVGVKNIFENE